MRILLLLFLGFIPSVLFAAETITVKARFLESEAAIPHDLASLAKREDLKVISTPSVTTRPGQRATIEMTEEQQPASIAPSEFQKVPLGLKLSITPDLKGSGVIYSAQLTICQLVTKTADGEKTSTEVLSRDLYISGQPKDGEAVWVDFVEPHSGRKAVVCIEFTRQPGLACPRIGTA